MSKAVKNEKVEPKKEETAVVKKEDLSPAIYEGLADDTPIVATDLVVPKILLMQGLSEAVANARAIMGEMRDSIDNKKMGDKEHPCEIIPFKCNKTWVIFEEKNGQMEYKEQVPWTPENDGWKWEEKVNGVTVRRDKSINYFVLIPEEITAGVFFPYLISFRRTSALAGRKLETARAKFGKFKKPICAKTFSLTCYKETNEKGTFYVFDVAEGRDTTKEELAAVSVWMETMKTQTIKVDDSDLEKEAKTETQGAAKVPEQKDMMKF